MLKNKILLGIILSIILLLFSINGFATDYKYTQESGAGFFVGSPDKSDAQEDTNEIRQIVNDLGTLLFHSKMDGLYPKDLTTGGTIQIPETGLKFGNDPVNDDIAAYISGEMMWQTKAELGIDLTLYYLKTEINTQTKVETIWGVSLVNDGDLDLYYLKTAIDTQSEMETIWGVSLANDSELHSQNTDTDLNATFELTFVKKTDNVNVLNDITSPGADIEDAVTKKHTSGSETLIGDVSGTVGANTVDKIKDHTVDETDIGDNKILVYKTTGNKYVYEAQSGGGASTFVELTDTPVNYTGQAGLYTKVNAGETALEFGTPGGGVDTSGTPEANDIARFTDVDTIEGINYTELKTALALSSGDLSDVASIAMLDENETVAAEWTFTSFYHVKRLQDIASLGPTLNFDRYRDGNPTSNVSNNDNLGKIYFNGYYEGMNDGAFIAAYVDGTPGAGDMPTRLGFYTSPDGYALPYLRMAIDNAGNIKMGDGAWTNYVNISNAGALTFQGTASITLPANSVDSANYVDASIDHEHLSPDVISGLTDVTSADADYMLIWDATDSLLKKVDMAEVRGGAGADTFAKFEIDGASQAAVAPTFDFDGTTFSIVEDPADDFDINVKTADTDTKGVLTAADWNIFNNKVGTELDPTVDSDAKIKAILVDEVTKTGDFTAGKITKINNTTGIIEQGTNTDTDVADAVTKKHTQNTDTQFDFYNALASDHLYSGEVDTQPVGESVVFGDLLYFNWTDKEWKKAKADNSATVPGLRISLESKADGQTCLMLIKGYIRDDSAFEFAGAMVYVSAATAGAMTSTAPSTAGNQLQRVGQAKSADILFFDPSIDVGEI